MNSPSHHIQAGNLVVMKPRYKRGYQSWVSDRTGLVLGVRDSSKLRILFTGAEHSIILPTYYFTLLE